MKAWTEDGPMSHLGDFYTYRFSIPGCVLQRPTALLYRGHRQPGNDRARRAAGLWLFGGIRHQEAGAGAQQQSARALGRPRPYGAADQLPLGIMTYGRRNAGEAEAEFIDHMRFFFEDGLRTVPQYLAPPGYLSIDQLKARARGGQTARPFDFKLVSDALFVAVGTAEKVANQIGEWGEMMGTTHFNIQGRSAICRTGSDEKHAADRRGCMPLVRGKQPRALPPNDTGRKPMVDFKKETLKINGVETVLYTAARASRSCFCTGPARFMVTNSPSPGRTSSSHPSLSSRICESGDDPAMDTFNDTSCIMLGCSMRSGSVRSISSASRSAAIWRRNLPRRAPAGQVADARSAGGHAQRPISDARCARTPGEQMSAVSPRISRSSSLAADRAGPGIHGPRYREATTLARLLWEKPWDPKFLRYLHRINVPTLIVWGDEDKMVPPQHADLWKKALPNARVEISKALAIWFSTRSRRPPTPSPPSRGA